MKFSDGQTGEGIPWLQTVDKAERVNIPKKVASLRVKLTSFLEDSRQRWEVGSFHGLSFIQNSKGKQDVVGWMRNQSGPPYLQEAVHQ